jgi:hypothetical protein
MTRAWVLHLVPGSVSAHFADPHGAVAEHIVVAVDQSGPDDHRCYGGVSDDVTGMKTFQPAISM